MTMLARPVPVPPTCETRFRELAERLRKATDTTDDTKSAVFAELAEMIDAILGDR